MNIKLCKICNKEFTNRNKYYCSKECSNIAKSTAMRERWKNSEYRDKQAKTRKDFWEKRSDIAREKMSKAAKHRQIAERIKREKHKARSELSKKTANKLWEDAHYREIMINKDTTKIKEKWKNSDYRDKMKEISKNNMLKLLNNRDEEKHKLLAKEMMINRWKDSSYRKKMELVRKNTNYNCGYDIYKRYKKYNITHCYLYIVTFNNGVNSFFKLGISKTKKRPMNFVNNYNHLNSNLLLLLYGESEILCKCERYIHFKMKIPKFKQSEIKNGRSEIYDIKYLDEVLKYIEDNI